jgi:hypothetical protein
VQKPRPRVRNISFLLDTTNLLWTIMSGERTPMKHVTAFLAIAILGCAVQASPVVNAERERQLAREREKLERETDPVDRAKIGIKISELLLASVGEAVREEDFITMSARLDEYATVIEDAHNTMMNSGRDAQKKSAGFKELEIALRKHVLRFDDLARALSLSHRPPVEQVKDLASALRDGLLKALFR